MTFDRCYIFNIRSVKPLIVSEMTLKGHLRSRAMSPFVKSPALPIRDRKSMLQLIVFREKQLTRHLKSIKVNGDGVDRPHISFY